MSNTLEFVREDTPQVNMSIYNLIINTNQTSAKVSMLDFKKQVRNMLQGFKGQDYIVVREDYPRDPKMRIKLKPNFEVGKKLGRIHCHCYVEITHSTNIFKLNTQKMKEHLPPGYNCFARFHPSSVSQTRLLRYNAKDIIDTRQPPSSSSGQHPQYPQYSPSS